VRRRFTAMLAGLAAFALLAAACQADEPGPEQSPQRAQKGGTFRAEMEGLVMNCNFDPTCEFVSYWNMTFTNVFLRPLMNYRHVAGQRGLEVLPDLAADLPEISEDGLTYTFTLKDGVMFGPPVSREVTSEDVAYAFKRTASQPQGNPYTKYYEGVIEGFEVQKKSPEEIEISGIETPDAKTLVIRLVSAAPDILFRLAMPATAPIPAEVANCFDQSGDYGRFAIATGPYMIEGSENLNISSCEAMEPISGFEPDRSLSLVRNPDYDPSTDNPEMRSSNPDRFEFAVNTNVQDIFNKIDANELESTPDDPPAQFIRKYADDRRRLPVNPLEVIWYLGMNLTQPPFDDIHVRKAVNLVIDKDGLLRSAGGSLTGEIATHILHESLGGLPQSEYDPYATPDFAGDAELAKEEMAQSRYDTDGDGVCDAPECKNVLHLTRNEHPWTEFTPAIEDNLSQIGIELRTRELEGGAAYETASTTSANIPFTSHLGWGKDWPDASTIFALTLGSGGIQPGPGVNNNTSLVGITPELNQERSLEIEGNLENVPSVDEKLDECTAIPLGQERLDCFVELDRIVMEDVVPWVPYRWDQETHLLSESLVKWEFDQNAGEMALAHIAVDASKQA
jgi:peptide/nickel transport system substrate-binding protein